MKVELQGRSNAAFVYYGLKFEFPYYIALALIFLSAIINSYLEVNKKKFLTIQVTEGNPKRAESDHFHLEVEFLLSFHASAGSWPAQ